MKTIIVVLFCIFSINSFASTQNPDGSFTVSQKEWLKLKSIFQSLSMSTLKMSKTLKDNQLELAATIADADALRKSNIEIMNVNISLLQERDQLKNTMSAMVNCPKAPVSSGPTIGMVGWEIPTSRVSGKAILPTEVGGYFLYYGTNKDNLNVKLKLTDRNIISYTINGLAPNTYFFAVSAYDTDGLESPRSAVVTKTIK